MSLEKKAIERIKIASEMSLHYYKNPIICTYSGGKDSDVLLELFKRSGVPFEVFNSHTTADAPQTIYHIQKVFRKLELDGIKCNIDYHIKNGKPVTMWNLIPNKLIPPFRTKRYCCSILKETDCNNRMIATGVRWDESNQRKKRESFEVIGKAKKDRINVSDEKMLLSDNDEKRKLFERCQMKAKTVVNPIIDWKDEEIWDFYWNECKTHNLLYYEFGYYRVGCIGCPMAGKIRWKEFSDFPKYKEAYIRAFGRMLDMRTQKGLTHKWKNAEDVFLWWMEDDNIPGQMSIEDYSQDLDDYN